MILIKACGLSSPTVRHANFHLQFTKIYLNTQNFRRLRRHIFFKCNLYIVWITLYKHILHLRTLACAADLQFTSCPHASLRGRFTIYLWTLACATDLQFTSSPHASVRSRFTIYLCTPAGSADFVNLLHMLACGGKL